ncbi:MAG: RHS repeat-associated core domain-containing protein [Pseudomonadota bacterium]
MSNVFLRVAAVRLRVCAAMAISCLLAAWALPAQAVAFGGPAPAPMCYVQPDQVWGGPLCSPGATVQGADSAVSQACDIYARRVNSTGTGGPHTYSCAAASTLDTCALSSPAVPSNWVGGRGANVTYRISATDTQATGNPLRLQSWATENVGPFCECPANAIIRDDASCACPAGMFWNDARQRCEPAPYLIQITGPSTTKTLIAGPSLPQQAIVTQNGGAVPNIGVSISVSGRPAMRGVTDGAGVFRFDYVPPYFPTIDTISGTCDGCSNTASKNVTVTASDMCGGVGNPIQPATGEKLQDETDWIDSAVHPLSFVRHYRSLGNAAGGLGQSWSHEYAAFAVVTEADAVVRFGDGARVMLRKSGSSWVADNSKDRLVVTPTSLSFIRASDESGWNFDGGGKLQTISQRNGWTMRLAYVNGQLDSVTNAFGRRLQFVHDSAGRITSIVAPDGQRISYGYNGSGRLSTVTYPGNQTRSYQYHDTRWPMALTGIVDETGAQSASFAYDEFGRAVSTQHAGAAGQFTVTYGSGTSTQGSVASATPQAQSSNFAMSAQVRDPLGTVRNYTWLGGDGQIRLAGVDGAYDGNSIARTDFIALQLPQSETDFLGVRTVYEWDMQRMLKLTSTRAAGLPEEQTRSIQWHPVFRLPELVTEAGRTTRYEYDVRGNTLSQTQTNTATGATRRTSWSYTSEGLVESMTDASGGIWRYDYDAVGNLRSVKNPKGHEAVYTHDGAGRLLREVEPGGLVTTYEYDGRGRLWSMRRGDETTSYRYNALGLISTVIMPSGYTMSYQYDEAQRLRMVLDNRGATIEYGLDGAGNRVSETVRDTNGNLVLQAGRVIDALNRVRVITGAQGQATSIGYDANGAPTSVTDPLHKTTALSLDGLGRTTRTTFADNAVVRTDWDKLDQLRAVTDPKGVQTSYGVTALGDVKSETSPDIASLTYEHDSAGRVTSVTDGKGSKTVITRDALGRPTDIRHGSEPVQAFDWDTQVKGYLYSVSDKTGSVVYLRDNQGRITRKTTTVLDDPSSPSKYTVSYMYSGGDLSSVIYKSGLTVDYLRTAGRITGITVREPSSTRRQTTAPKPFITSLRHNALGQAQSWTWWNGDAAQRSFDTDGRMTATDFASYQYDAAGRIIGITQRLWAMGGPRSELYPMQLSWTAGYDSRDRLTSFNRDGAQTSYSYDANSNRLTALDKVTGDADLDGLFESSDQTRTTSQALRIDEASNRLLGFTPTLTTTRNGTVTSVAKLPVNYTLDANGAMTSDGLREFTFDAARRMSKVTLVKNGEAASVTYLTNAMGQRVFKTVVQAGHSKPDEQKLGRDFTSWLRQTFGWLFSSRDARGAGLGTAYVYGDGQIPEWAMLGEYDNGTAEGKGNTEYIWLPTEDGSAIPVGLYRNGQFYAMHTDHLGTPRLVTDGLKKPVWQWLYSAFGNNEPIGVLMDARNVDRAPTKKPVLPRASEPLEMNLRFPGQYADAEAGVFQNWHREYSARTGRYVQSDPIGLAGGINTFGYVRGNPLGLTDPLGLAVKCKTVVKIPLIGDLQECTEDGKTPTEQEARDAKRMSERELNKACRANGYEDAHSLKRDLGLDSKSDIFVDKNGNLYSGPRKGSGVPQYLHMNTRGIVPRL